MDLNKYRVDFDITYTPAAGIPKSTPGYELVYAGSDASAKLVAKARALASLKKQNCKLVMIDLKDPILLEKAEKT